MDCFFHFQCIFSLCAVIQELHLYEDATLQCYKIHFAYRKVMDFIESLSGNLWLTKCWNSEVCAIHIIMFHRADRWYHIPIQLSPDSRGLQQSMQYELEWHWINLTDPASVEVINRIFKYGMRRGENMTCIHVFCRNTGPARYGRSIRGYMQDNSHIPVTSPLMWFTNRNSVISKLLGLETKYTCCKMGWEAAE